MSTLCRVEGLGADISHQWCLRNRCHAALHIVIKDMILSLRNLRDIFSVLHVILLAHWLLLRKSLSPSRSSLHELGLEGLL